MNAGYALATDSSSAPAFRNPFVNALHNVSRRNSAVALGSLGDFTGFNTLRAHPDVANRSGHKRADALQIRMKSSLGSVIRVTDAVTRKCSFAADVTTICHAQHSPV